MSDSEHNDPWASLADTLGAKPPAASPTPPPAKPTAPPAARQPQKPKPPVKPAAQADWGDLASSLGLEPAAPRPATPPPARPPRPPQASGGAAGDRGVDTGSRRRDRDDDEFGFGPRGSAPVPERPVGAASFEDRREQRREPPRSESAGEAEPSRSSGERADAPRRDDEQREGRGRRRRGRRGGRGRGGSRRDDDRATVERLPDDREGERWSPAAEEPHDAFDHTPRDADAPLREPSQRDDSDREPRAEGQPGSGGDSEGGQRRRRRRGRRGGRRRSRGDAINDAAARPAEGRGPDAARDLDDDAGDEPLPAGYGVRPIRPAEPGRSEPGRRDATSEGSGGGEDGGRDEGSSSERRGRRRRRRRRGDGSGREAAAGGSRSGSTQNGGGRRGSRGGRRSGGERRSTSNLSRGRRDDFAPVAGGREEDDEGLEFLGIEEAGQEAQGRAERSAPEEDESIVESGLSTVLDVPSWVEAIGIVIAGNLDSRSRSPRSGDQGSRSGGSDRPRDGRRGGRSGE